MSVKRLFDLTASFIGLLLLFPVYVIIAVLIRIITPGPVFFIQYRSGRHAKPFKIYKFRSMKVNPEGGTVTVKGDSRITALGAFLRKYKLDELPELWNVIKGDMSLVGPRPDLPCYSQKLEGIEKLILELRPGITGPATLKYYNEEELLANSDDPQKYNDEVLWKDKVRLNLDYYYNRSFIGDIVLIFKTVFHIGNRPLNNSELNNWATTL